MKYLHGTTVPYGMHHEPPSEVPLLDMYFCILSWQFLDMPLESNKMITMFTF